ncbi:MAG: hypothetical protein N2572_05225 [Syntrophales bacterium]|nr:hypothetical protein [Syntrophales bacterium]
MGKIEETKIAMKSVSSLRIMFFLLGLLSFPLVAKGEEMSCKQCHADKIDYISFYKSIHRTLSCRSCHDGVSRLELHMQGNDRAKEVNCAKCHQNVFQKYRRDVHNVKLNMACQDCHQPIHALKRGRSLSSCNQCHPRENYVLRGHGRALEAGNMDAPSCADCHGLHNISVYDLASEKAQSLARETYTKRCISCHGNVKIAKRNKFSTQTVKSYYETYHGKVLRVGYTDKVAGCADCHTGHNTLPKTDSASAIHPDNLYHTCRSCHPIMHKRFVQFDPHPNPSDPKRSRIVYWVNVFMIALLTGTFAFFWTHSLLWWRRAYLEKYREGKKLIQVTLPGEKQVERFTFRDRMMHVLLVISFFILVLTGFPIKYADAPWAKMLLNFWGGPHAAGTFHRIAAITLCLLFLYTCWLSFKFLFPKGEKSGWVKRLLGPDSLFPNLKDLKDIVGMFRWFFHRGEMPKFDRWTYWEKFDFMAVFWGMTVIGFSGFILWFPGLFSYLLPGWMINVAMVVHSEEAFLAAIFIFTVHFFNNHLVPTKFPLERNIFTGRYPLETMKIERPLEYERMLAEGRLEEIKKDAPGIGTQLFASLFGLGSLILGLILAFMIFWAAIF